ncbi:LAME_0E05952g1_1 [Lachancea meyersii CBS 8951]|uniref:Ribosome biogenesis protein SLX9 n=1 Tax=Lachancea meyersii CBS 8951 TaxID=1266667 RepID=A0A1G4JHY1_9SACH|nr:LAME_0E05952g1_1 [Lachancea meyersii CBS 8951]
MVAKKRNQLRTKAALRLGQSKSAIENEPTEPVNLPEDPKAFLHQARESKKDKMLNKSQSFLSKLQEKTSLNGAISKSALRRRKRKMRDQLKPRMEDLLISLEQDGVTEATKDMADSAESDRNNQDSNGAGFRNVTRISTATLPSESGSVLIRKNEPSIRNQRGAKMLTGKEIDRFQNVLQNKQFQQNPFAALKEVIQAQKNQ